MNNFSRDIARVSLRESDDVLAIAAAISLPWSTSISGILIALWIVSVLVLSLSQLQKRLSGLLRYLAAPAGGLPVALWLLAVLAMFWADVPWGERFHGLGGFNKLLVIPVLLFQFSHSHRAHYVAGGFFASCAALLVLSWLFVFWPSIAWYAVRFPGVPVKDYIAQSGEFVLCAFGSLHVALNTLAVRRYVLALFLIGLSVAFLASVFYVATARTELFVIFFLFIALAIRHFGLKGASVALLGSAAIATVLWFTSPYLRDRVTSVMREVQLAQTNDSLASEAGNPLVSAGQHISLLKRSLQIFEQAPLIGHGTGSITEAFRQSAVGQKGIDDFVSSNPHNQFFAVAIQLGLLGALLLCAMWLCHILLFWRGGAEGWIGTLLVTQNIVSSQLNSHLFDFTQGWTYVFGVGAIGGAILHARQQAGSVPR